MQSARFFSLRQVLAVFFLSAIVIAVALASFWAARQSRHTAAAFDPHLLADEPLQMGDIRLALQSAIESAEDGHWSIALRLIRDGRNQWELFLPSMRDVYSIYCWTPVDINRANKLWEKAIEQVELRNERQVRDTIASFIGIMNKYRQPRAG